MYFEIFRKSDFSVWKNCEIHLLNGETVVSQAVDWCNLVETTDENKGKLCEKFIPV